MEASINNKHQRFNCNTVNPSLVAEQVVSTITGGNVHHPLMSVRFHSLTGSVGGKSSDVKSVAKSDTTCDTTCCEQQTVYVSPTEHTQFHESNDTSLAAKVESMMFNSYLNKAKGSIVGKLDEFSAYISIEEMAILFLALLLSWLISKLIAKIPSSIVKVSSVSVQDLESLTLTMV